MRPAEDARSRLRALGMLVLAAWAIVLAASCTPESGLQTIDDYEVVLTLYDKQADFGSIRTYLMPDSVVHFQDPQNPGRPISHDYDDLILERVEYNLQAVGYRREADPDHNDPDVYVLVSATSSEWRALEYSWLPRWGWWGYWPGATSDWYFQSPYYGGGRVYTFSTGTLLIDMADYRSADEEEGEIAGIWTAAINGVLTDETSDVPHRLVDLIDRAFRQSPYLGTDE